MLTNTNSDANSGVALIETDNTLPHNNENLEQEHQGQEVFQEQNDDEDYQDEDVQEQNDDEGWGSWGFIIPASHHSEMWNSRLDNLPTLVEDVTENWGNLEGQPIDPTDTLYLNRILEHEPGEKSFEEWLKITIVSCHDHLEENPYNYQMSSNEIVNLLIQNNDDDFRYDPLLPNTMIMATAVEDIIELDVFKDYAHAYSYYKAYSEANLN